jgi:hypothetical protein
MGEDKPGPGTGVIADMHTRDVPVNHNYYKDNFWRKKGYR